MAGKRYLCASADCGKLLSKTAWYDHQKKHKMANAKFPTSSHTISIDGSNALSKDGCNTADKNDHGDNVMFACSFCSKIFGQKTSLSSHVLSHINVVAETNEISHICDQCHRTFLTAGQLSKHRLCHTSEKQFICDVCGFGFPRKTSLERHALTHGNQAYKCPVCNIGYASEINLRHHLYKHEESLPTSITQENLDSGPDNECYVDKSTELVSEVTSDSLNFSIDHKNEGHVRKDSKKAVASDSQNITLDCEMDGHNGMNLKTESSMTDRSCKGESQQYNRKEHRFANSIPDKGDKLEHSRTNSNKIRHSLACSIFPKNKNNVADVDSKPKIFECNSCNQIFDAKKSLQLHVLSHVVKDAKKENHVCETCHKSFSSSNQLYEHHICPLENKRCVCRVCGLRFTRTSSLKRHTSTHGNQKHICPVCNVGYATASILKYHQSKHKIDLCSEKINSNNTNTDIFDQTLESPLNSSKRLSIRTECVYRGLLDLQMGLKHLKLCVTSEDGSDVQTTSSDGLTVIKDTETSSFSLPPNIEKQSVTVIVTHERITIDFHLPEHGDNCSQFDKTSESEQSNQSDIKSNFHAQSVLPSTTQKNVDPYIDNEGSVEKSSVLAAACTSNFQNLENKSQGQDRTCLEIERNMIDNSEILDKNCSSQSHILSHIVTKTNEEAHICDKCPRTFSTPHQLLKHRLCHARKNQCICNLCGFVFPRKTSLERHALIHGNQKYKCHICKVGYESENSLKNHQRIHEESLLTPNTQINIESEIEKEGYEDNSKKLLTASKSDTQNVDMDHENEVQNRTTSKIEETRTGHCEILDEKDPSQSHVQSCIVTKRNGESYVCDKCHRTFSTLRQLSKHRLCYEAKKRYTCDVCGCGFTRKTSLERHAGTHGSQKYKCPVCNIGYESEINLKNHQQTHEESSKSNPTAQIDIEPVADTEISMEKCTTPLTLFDKHADMDHETKGPNRTNEMEETVAGHSGNESDNVANIDTKHKIIFACSFCTEVFDGKNSLQSHILHHIMTKRKKKTHVCNICHKSFINTQRLTAHHRCHTGSRPFVCAVCGLRFAQKSNLNRHSSTHGNQEHKCTVCKIGYASESSLKHHQCTSKFSAMISLTSNNMDMGVDNEKSIATTAENSENHMVDHGSYVESRGKGQMGQVYKTYWKDVTKYEEGGEVYYTCNKCSITYPDCTQMKRHMKSEHNGLPCQVCGKVLLSSVSFSRHLRTHTGERPYQCEKCGKRFVCKTGLHVHRFSHSTKRPHHCRVCGKGFTNTGGLHEHERIHTGEKRNQCDSCGKNFTHRATLKNHIMVMHSEERPFECSECPRAFPVAYLLRRHLTLHTGEKGFKCYKCGKAFRSSSHLSRHKKIHYKANHSSKLRPVDKGQVKLEDSEYGSYMDNDVDGSSQTAVSSIVLDMESISGNPTFVSIDENAGVSVEEVVVGGESVSVDDFEQPDNVYQCTGCLNMFKDMETATNHICLSDIVNDSIC